DEVIRERVLGRDNGNEYRNADEAVEINRHFLGRAPREGEIRVRCNDVTAEEVAQCILDALSIAEKPLQM
ncbi:MAG: hypothetical protein J6N32_06255, partial [Clostridia bacterium]|nr:hypothetical protein [Clostridia bacterium]